MSNKLGKIQRNAQKLEMDQIYKNMTPEQYKENIRMVVRNTIEDLGKTYDAQLDKMRKEYNRSIMESTMIAMDTLSIEILYELGRVLECYVDEPENLEQKIEVVQNIYQASMDSIKKYANYKTDNQARKVFEKKKKTVEKVFGIYGGKE